MLTEDPLPRWASGRRVVAVGGQTNRPVDDVGAVTDAGGWVTIQAKKGMRVDGRPGGALAEALRQLVEIGDVGVPDGTREVLRPLDPTRDLVLILSDDSAPRTVNDRLTPLTGALRGLPATVPLSDAASSGQRLKDLGLLREVLGQCWRDQHASDLPEPEFRRLTSVLSIRALRIAEDGEDFATVRTMLRELAGDTTAALDLWKALSLEGQRLVEEHGYLDRDGLIKVLDAQGIVLRPLARLRADIDRLRALSSTNTQALEDSVSLTTPDGAVRVTRAIQPMLLSATGNLAITGAPGCGKTALLHALATSAAGTHDVVLLRSDDLRSTKADTRAELRLSHDLAEVLVGWTDRRPGLILIDGIDQARGNETPSWLPALASSLSGTRWRIVASVRSFDLRHGAQWRKMFAGTPVDPEAADPELRAVRHLLVADLTPDELAVLRSASPRVAGLLDGASDRLRALLANPFNLDLAGQLLAEGELDLQRIHRRSELLDLYWHRRIGHGPASLDRVRALRAVVRGTLASGRQSVSLIDLPAEATREALTALHHDGVLRDMPARPGLGTVPRAHFAHPVLFDYAVAMLALGDPEVPASLADALDVNPNLAITVRPSLEYRLATAWGTDTSHRGFWILALRLAGQEGGHPLAANETARVAASAMTEATDLDPLVEAATAAIPEPADQQRRTAAHYLSFMLAAAVARDPSVQSLGCIDALASALARRALSADDLDLALLAAQLPVRAASAYGSSSTQQPTYTWTTTTASNCMAVALRQPDDPRRIRLAEPAGRLLVLAATVDPLAVSDSITEVIAPTALRAWGMTVLQHLIRALPAIAAKAPELAVEIGVAPWLYEEERRTPTPLLNSAIHGLTSNLQQEVESQRYAAGIEFAKIMNADSAAGTGMLLRILQAPDMLQLPEPEEPGELPCLRQGRPLAYAGGHQILVQMVGTFCEVLGRLAAAANDAQNEAAAYIITRLVAELSHGEAWRHLLAHAARAQSPALATAVLPALSSPSVYAHHETWNEAAHAACRAAPHLSAEELADIRRAVHAITDDHTLSTRPEFRAALEERVGMIVTDLDATADGSASPASDSAPSISTQPALPPIRDISEEPFVGRSEEEKPLPGSFDDVARRIHEQLKNPTHAGQDDDASTCEMLTALWDDLATVSVAERDRAEADLLAVDIADRLAACPDTTPDSPLGEKILAAVLASAPTGTEASSDEATDPSSWSSALTAGWGVTAATSGAQSLVHLHQRENWRLAYGETLRERIERLLESPSPLYRFLATDALPSMFPDADTLIAELAERLTQENDRNVATRLMGMLAWFVHREPFLVDAAIQHLSALPRWVVLTASRAGEQTVGPADEGGGGVDIIAILAAVHDTPYCREVLSAWLSAPVDHPERATKALHCLRDVFNPADPALELAQERVLTLAQRGLAQVRTTISSANPSEPNDEKQRATVHSAVTFADHLARVLYSASGAFDAKHATQSPPARGDTQRFALFAFPLLDALSAVPVPRITLNVVQTLDHIAAADAQRALSIAVNAVAGDEAYCREQAGVHAALELVRHFAADHREIFLGDAESTTAVRRMLESFIRVGWDQAIELAAELDELFT